MTCPLPSFTARAASLLLVTIVTSRALTAQAPRPVPPPVPVPVPAPVSPASAPVPLSLAYRVPVIALVQPPASSGSAGSVPQDRPVVVFRFTAGEAHDPLDTRTFSVAVDGIDRSALFQVAAGEAWGSLAEPADLQHGRFSLGPHTVVARICSTRGPCGTVAATVIAMPPLATTSVGAAPATPSTRRRLLDAVLVVTRRLLTP